ncbi:MAG: type 2 isopentenyl-diphosphate Delta-isomerase [Desulfurococcaceae archaeon]|uniref:Isopentenyl-diphosphate delta-isomerase n=1 Tax=Staphylothermus marinus TaxID=2280 RepID=A0A7C4H8I4_STAMA
MDHSISNRKIEHIDIVLKENVDYNGWCKTIYESIKLIHQALPGINYKEIDLSTNFLKYSLNAPIIITGITGGHVDTIKINEQLAKLVSKHRLAIGVGSQRPLINNRDDKIIESYRVVRKYVKDLPVIGNIGYSTLSKLSVKDIESIIKTIEADALAIHLNPGQEIIQPEGDTDFGYNTLVFIEELLDYLDIPIIIKEVGTGLSRETVSKLYSIGIRFFDVAGACGTNWIMVEKHRCRENVIKQKVADYLKDWGIPTPLSVIETRIEAPDSYIIASGGVWNGLQAVKNLVLGANIVGLAKPVLKKLLIEGFEAVDKYIEEYVETMKTIMFLIGANNVQSLAEKPVVLLEPVSTYLEQRGVDVKQYIERIRSRKWIQ